MPNTCGPGTRLDELRSVVSQAVTDVLETMFFCAAAEENADGSEPANAISAVLEFTGEPSGRCRLLLSHAAARMLAADFLSEEASSVWQAECEQVACELSNMICGCVLSRVQPEARFELSSPRIDPLGVLGRDALEVWFSMDGGRLAFAVEFDTPAECR